MKSFWEKNASTKYETATTTAAAKKKKVNIIFVRSKDKSFFRIFYTKVHHLAIWSDWETSKLSGWERC